MLVVAWGIDVESEGEEDIIEGSAVFASFMREMASLICSVIGMAFLMSSVFLMVGALPFFMHEMAFLIRVVKGTSLLTCKYSYCSIISSRKCSSSSLIGMLSSCFSVIRNTASKAGMPLSFLSALRNVAMASSAGE